jgi:ATP-dependent RNA helicase DDX51/DBP6
MAIDILIATPGRLAEHILHTPGFTLQHLQFLVLDEADRLLHQSFQNWTELVIREISSPKVITSMDIVECLRGTSTLPIVGQRYMDLFLEESRDAQIRNVRKFIFSATLTHDVGKLTSLQIHSPEIVSISADEQPGNVEEIVDDDAIFTLPSTLREYVVTSMDDRPLLLLHILNKYRLQDKTLIFTHSTETASRLNHLLMRFYKSTDSGVRTAVISSEVPLKARKKLLSTFTAGKLDMYALFKQN